MSSTGRIRLLNLTHLPVDKGLLLTSVWQHVHMLLYLSVVVVFAMTQIPDSIDIMI